MSCITFSRIALTKRRSTSTKKLKRRRFRSQTRFFQAWRTSKKNKASLKWSSKVRSKGNTRKNSTETISRIAWLKDWMTRSNSPCSWLAAAPHWSLTVSRCSCSMMTTTGRIRFTRNMENSSKSIASLNMNQSSRFVTLKPLNWRRSWPKLSTLSTASASLKALGSSLRHWSFLPSCSPWSSKRTCFRLYIHCSSSSTWRRQ